jgi:hypothetical protein
MNALRLAPGVARANTHPHSMRRDPLAGRNPFTLQRKQRGRSLTELRIRRPPWRIPLADWGYVTLNGLWKSRGRLMSLWRLFFHMPAPHPLRLTRKAGGSLLPSPYNNPSNRDGGENRTGRNMHRLYGRGPEVLSGLSGLPMLLLGQKGAIRTDRPGLVVQCLQIAMPSPPTTVLRLS